MDGNADTQAIRILPLGTATVPHFHVQPELVLVHGGSVLAVVSGERATLTAGSVCFAGENDVHAFVPQSDSRAELVCFAPSVLQKFFAAARGQAAQKHFFADSELYNALSGLAAQANASTNALFCEGLASAMLGLMLEHADFAPPVPDAQSTVMRAALTYICAHANEPLSLDGLAQRFDYSKFHFSNLFHKYTATNLKRYINTVRLQQTVRRLMAGEESAAACQSAGFTSERTFYRSFMQVFGVSPQKYVALQKDNQWTKTAQL